MAWLVVALLFSFVVFVADDMTGSEISLSLFYLFAVAIASWWVGRWAGVLVSGFSAAGWLVAYWLNRRFYSHPHILPWNLAVELGIFLAATASISAIRRGLERQRALMLKLGEAYRRLDQEFELVGNIQRSLLPASLPSIPGYRHAIYYAPSTRAGGDYYDSFELPGGRRGILIADASGHGPASAVVMATMRALMHAAPEALVEPERALATANAHLIESILAGQFVTACYLILDPPTGRVEYSLAGHNPPLVARARVRPIEEFRNPSGLPLGILNGVQFSRERTCLEPGDTLLLYTDGLTETEDRAGCMFEVEPVAALLAQYRHAPPEEIRDRILEALRRHQGSAPQADDVTLIVLQAEPRTGAG